MDVNHSIEVTPEEILGSEGEEEETEEDDIEVGDKADSPKGGRGCSPSIVAYYSFMWSLESYDVVSFQPYPLCFELWG